MPKFIRPLTDKQRKALEQRESPNVTITQQARDDLLEYLALRVAELESQVESAKEVSK